MKVKLSVLFFLLLFSYNICSQENRYVDEGALGTFAKIDFGFSGLGVSFDTPLSDKVLLEFGAGLGAAYQIDEDFKYRLYFDDPAFFATAHAKYYFKQKKVIDNKGRNVSFNTGNFFGIKVKYASPTLHDEKMWHTLLTGVNWGLQRKLGKHFLYQLNLGIGAAIDIDSKTTTHMTLFPDANFRLSYVLPFY